MKDNQWFTKDYVEYFKNSIEQNYNKDIVFLKEKKEKKINLNHDKIYNMASVRDTKKLFLTNKINSINNMLEAKLNEIDFKLKDGMIDEDTCKKLKDQTILEFNNKYESKIKKIETQMDTYDDKLEKQISVKREQYKLKNEKVSINFDKKINKVEEKKLEKISKAINSKADLINKIGIEINDKKTKKLQQTSIYKKIDDLDEQLKEKQIGKLTYERELEILEPKLNGKVTSIDNKLSNFTLKKYDLLAKTSNFISYERLDNFNKGFLNFLNSMKLLIVIMFVAIIAGVNNPNFFTERTWVNLIQNNLDLLLVALGMTLIILTGGIDLSVGSVLGFSGALTVKYLQNGHTLGASIALGMICAMLFGLISGVLIHYVKLQPFIVTLVLMIALRGATYLVLNSSALQLPPDTFRELVLPKFGKWAPSTILVLLIFLVLFVMLKHYKYGVYVYAIGGNMKAAELSGIKVRVVGVSVYVISGLLVYIGTMIYVARLNSIAPASGTQLELDAIACVALGGTSLIGGKGGVVKTLLGWFVICVLSTAMNQMGISSYWQLIVKGMVILLAVVSDKKINLIQRIKKTLFNLKYRW